MADLNWAAISFVSPTLIASSTDCAKPAMIVSASSDVKFSTIERKKAKIQKPPATNLTRAIHKKQQQSGITQNTFVLHESDKENRPCF